MMLKNVSPHSQWNKWKKLDMMLIQVKLHLQWINTSPELTKTTLTLISRKSHWWCLKLTNLIRKKTKKPDPYFLKKNLWIHDDDTVSTFYEGDTGESLIVSMEPSQWFNPIPSDVTPSTLSKSTEVPPEVLASITKQVYQKLIIEFSREVANPNPESNHTPPM